MNIFQHSPCDFWHKFHTEHNMRPVAAQKNLYLTRHWTKTRPSVTIPSTHKQHSALISRVLIRSMIALKSNSSFFYCVLFISLLFFELAVANRANAWVNWQMPIDHLSIMELKRRRRSEEKNCMRNEMLVVPLICVVVFAKSFIVRLGRSVTSDFVKTKSNK